MWKRIITAVVVAGLIIGLGAVGYFQSQNYIAKVSNDKILNYEYKFFLNLKKLQMESEAGIDGEDEQARQDYWNQKQNGQDPVTLAKNTALEMAKEYKIQLIKAQEYGLKISDEIEKTVENDINQYMTTEEMANEYKDYVQNDLGITLNQFKEIKKKLELVWEFRNQYVRDNRNVVSVTEDEARAYYDENRDLLDEVTVRNILFLTVEDPSQGKELVELSEAEQNAKKENAEDILARIQNGEDMDALAREYTEDPSLKEQGGLHAFAKGQMMQEYEDWAFSANIGDTGIVKTGYGYHVVRLEGRTGYDDKSELAKSQMKYQRLEEWYKNQLEEWKRLPEFNLIKNEKVYDKITID